MEYGVKSLALVIFSYDTYLVMTETNSNKASYEEL